ncbi:hypothetical protein GGS20DRAFT_584655 [Poronia punctata]|nr:hypothetical protein GGS20DRAFT_584655 [Poronia punctata]
METTFSDDEKRFVLGEIIKVSTIDVLTVVDFIKSHKIEPNWMLMQLPGGRNMQQCVGAVDNMFRVKFPPPNLGGFSKRKSLGDLVDHPAKRQAITAPFEPSLAPIRALQPRPPATTAHAPPHVSGYPPPVASVTTSTTTTGTPGGTGTGKKRGRPSKADKEAQAQARAAYARPTEYPPITPAPPALPAPPAFTAPAAAQPPREFASPPGYELAGNGAEQAQNKRPRLANNDSPRQGGNSLTLASPASTTGTPHTYSEPLEQPERKNLSPGDGSSVPMDSRSPQLPPVSQQQNDHSQHHSHILPRPQTHHVPIQPSAHPLQPYEQYKGPDPIFPDRDRSRSIPSQMARNTPASPVVNRT